MWFLIDPTNQIVGTADKESEISTDYQGIEFDGTDPIQSLYFDGSKILSKPDQPDNTYWDSSSSTWKDVFVLSIPDVTLDQVKEAKRAALNDRCNAQIKAGFTSDALGTMHGYGGALEDQINLIGSASLGMDVVYVCTDLQTKLKGATPHTAAQIKKVLVDGSIVKLALIQKYRTLVDTVSSAATAVQVNAINW